MDYSKSNLLMLFRAEGENALKEISSLNITDEKKKSQIVNNHIMNYIRNIYENCEGDFKSIGSTDEKDKKQLIENLLMITYASDIIMLEYRNKVWEYDYMDFSRRVGEIWEPFCKIPFFHSITPLDLITPPSFDEVQKGFKNECIYTIGNSSLPKDEKSELQEGILLPWSFVDSGSIKLNLDLHFRQNNIHYNCDFKSGFSSNEKGNTNRLLLVASVYKALEEREKKYSVSEDSYKEIWEAIKDYCCDSEKSIIFCRQKESENNHYLERLKSSTLWEVYCADDAYDKIKEFTGFDLKAWIDKNIDWDADFTPEFKKHLVDADLLKYLEW